MNAGYDGDVYLTVVLNGFIHTVMYTYYFVSMHTKDIWWKKYLTLMQVCMFSQQYSDVGLSKNVFCTIHGTGCVRSRASQTRVEASTWLPKKRKF